MGYNTTVVVMNDALDVIEADPQFGARLAAAIRYAGAFPQLEHVNVEAHSSNCLHSNAAIVVETHHSSVTVTVEVGQNYGKVVARDRVPAR